MIGPMKKKVISSVIITALVLILLFVVVAFLYVNSTNKRIAELEVKSAVVQKLVLVNDMTAGDVITAADVIAVDVKGESAAVDTYNPNSLASLIGRRLKVNANAKTIVTDSILFDEDKTPGIDTRLQEFNMITLPSDLDVGDYVDVRIRLTTGEDYSVLVGKKIESFGASGTTSNTVFMRLNEEEIVRISSAIIESYIRDGVLLYANRYVDPDNQLHNYARINYVERYQDAEYLYITDAMSNDVFTDEDGKTYYKPANKENAEPVLVTDGRVARTLSEIASIIELDLNETENIKVALRDNDKETLEYYRDKLCVTDKSIVANYPVKPEVAALIAKNPNLLGEIKAKYKVDELIQQRVNFLDTNMTKVDPYTGEIVTNDEYIQSIATKLQTEINAQRTERQEYLLNLLSK